MGAAVGGRAQRQGRGERGNEVWRGNKRKKKGGEREAASTRKERTKQPLSDVDFRGKEIRARKERRKRGKAAEEEGGERQTLGRESGRGESEKGKQS